MASCSADRLKTDLIGPPKCFVARRKRSYGDRSPLLEKQEHRALAKRRRDGFRNRLTITLEFCTSVEVPVSLRQLD